MPSFLDKVKPIEHFKAGEHWSIQTELTHGIPGLVKVSKSKLEDPGLSMKTSTPGYRRMAGAEDIFLGNKEALREYIHKAYTNTKRIKFV